MTDHDVDIAIEEAAEAPYEVDAAIIERISSNVLPSLKAVRPLPPWWAIALCLHLIFMAVAILGATRLGLNGVRVLNLLQSTLIFGLLGSVGLVTASASASGMAPGSKIGFEPIKLLGICSLPFVVVFAVLFQDYRMDRFLSEGFDCLFTGLVHAVPTGLLLWVVIRRGLILDPTVAGLTCGTLAGLAGFGLLELHCPILKSMHLMVWHIAIIPLSAMAGYLAGRRVHDLGVKRRLAEFIQ